MSNRLSRFRGQSELQTVIERTTGLKAPTSAANMLALMSGADPKALRAGAAALPAPRVLVDDPTESELQEIIAATYQQLIDRVPQNPRFDAERLQRPAEAQLRSGSAGVVDFVAQVAASDLFQARLHALPPLQAAAAAQKPVGAAGPISPEVASRSFPRDQLLPDQSRRERPTASCC